MFKKGGHYSRKEKRNSSNNKVITAWSSGEYIPIAHPDFPSRLYSFCKKHAAALTEEQSSELLTATRECIGAYSEGRFQSYITFRLRVPGELRSNLPIYYSRIFESKAEANWLSLDEKAYFDSGKAAALLATIQSTNVFEKYIALKSQGTFYSNFFSAINLDKSRAIVFSTSSEPPSAFENVHFFDPQQPRGFRSIDGGFSNLGPMTKRGAFIHPDGVQSILERNKSIQVYQVLFYVKLGDKDNHYSPVAFTFCWSPQHVKWLPVEMVFGNTHDLSGIIPEF